MIKAFTLRSIDDFRFILALGELDRLSLEELQDICSENTDEPLVSQLHSYLIEVDSVYVDFKALLRKISDELQVSYPEKLNALKIAGCYLATQILKNEIDPYEGACAIQSLPNASDHDSILFGFWLVLDQIHDSLEFSQKLVGDPFNKDKWAEMENWIKEESQKFVNEFGVSIT